MKKKGLLGYYDYTVVLTYLGMLFAFRGIIDSIGENYISAVICLMLAGVCDMFDGAVASTKDRTVSEKKFGIQIDSLSDLISFGVLPGIFCYMISGQNPYVGIVSSIYVLCALIRLSFFNVLEEERQATTTEKRTVYLGVPVTTIAVILPLAYMFETKESFISTVIYVVVMILCACGFLSPLNIKKPKTVGKCLLIALGILEITGVALMKLNKF